MILRLDNRLIIKSNGYIPNPEALYNTRKYEVVMTNNTSCTDTQYLCQNTCQPAEYNFTILKGNTLDFDVVYKDASKLPVNLTGYSAKCVAQYNDKIFTINCNICDYTNGKIHLYMSPYETSKIFTLDYRYTNTTEYTYQLDLISPSKHIYRILEGTICVVPSAGGC